jgi:hypothetical protein
MKNPLHEYRVFLSYPHNMRVLLVTNLIYAFVLPVIEIFIGAYVMRNSNDVKMVLKPCNPCCLRIVSPWSACPISWHWRRKLEV